MKKLIPKLVDILRLVFGSFHWDLPQWPLWLKIRIASIGSRIKQEHQTEKKRFYRALAGFLIVIGVGAGIYYWYVNRPESVKLSVNGSTIDPTPLKKYATPETYKISFGGSAAKLSDVGKKITKGITISPRLDGDWKWTSDDTLVFTVAGDWPIGKTYTIKFDKDLFPKHVHLETYKIELSTPTFNVNISDTSFYQDPTKADDKKVITEVHFTHPVDPTSFEKNVTFTFLIGRGRGRTIKEQNVGFKATYDEFFGKAYLHSDNLPIPNYESEMRVEIAKGVRSKLPGQGSKQKREDSTTVPGMLTHFRIEDADLSLVRNDQYEPEQVLILNTTAGVAQKNLTEHMEVYALPIDRPALPNDKKVRKKYRWTVNDVSKHILSIATKVELTPIPTEQDYSEIISYKYKEEPGMYLYINTQKGLTSFGGYRLPEERSFVARVPEFPKELKIMAEGSLLSLAGEKKLSILARDMEYVRYRAQRLLPGQIAHFVTQSSGELGQPSFDDYRFGLENIAETFSEVRVLPVVAHGETQYSHFDFTDILDKSLGRPRGLFYFTAEGWDKVRKRPSGPQDRRFILITDIGILAKRSVDGSYDIFVQSISDGHPISGADVQVIGKNGLPVLTQVTGNDGHVRFSDLNDFKREKHPVVFVVTKAQDLSFLPIHTHVNRLNYSRFDVGGVYTKSQSDRLEGYMFSDRGIYRPGEEVRIGYIVKHSDWSRSLSGVNLEMKVTDPKGSLIRHTKGIRLNQVGFETYEFETGETWPTGSYTISLFVKQDKVRSVQIGSTTVSIEEFMPDRLKITARFSRPANKGWLSPADLQGLVSLQNLFGTPAQNRRVAGEISLVPSYPSFQLYKEWSFHDPMRSKKSFDEQLGEQTTDESGNATFDLGLDKFESASYLLRFVAEGFEADGGRSVLASNAVLISPLNYLVGYKAQGDLNYISKGTQIGVDFMAIDPDLKKVPVKDLTLKTIKFRQVSTLVKQSNGTYKYESVKKEYEVKQSEMTIASMGTSIELDTSQPGDFALILLNKDNLELNRVHYSVAGAANLTFELEKNAELQVKLNKSDFDPGAEIEINIRSPYVGAGLITIERERVFAHKWFTTDTKSTIQRIQIPSDLEGNGYVNVTFVRSLSSNEIFMSPLSTGVAPFSINKSSRINKISLKIPPLVRPGKNLDINVSAIRKGKAVVFAIDEGILQVAKYTTPDPLNSFYKKRALEVETRQILDLILPEFSKLALKRSSEAGGAASLLGKNLNPFKRKRDKAVAYWSGLITIGPDTKRLTYNVPDYFSGQLRVIAVAVSQEAMDAVEEKTLVKGHFVISPNTPNFVSPGDKLNISVGVSNNAEQSGKGAEIDVSLQTSENVKIEGASSIKLTIDEGSESSATFDVVVHEPLGNANFVFTATHQNKSSVRTVTSSVRPATPFITSLKAGYVDAGKKAEVATPRRMYTEFRTNEVSVSKLPMSLAKSFLTYLQKYPYGCTEQVISKGFPAVVLGEYNDFKSSKAKVASQVQGITEILAARQLPEGGFIKWPGNSTINAFHTMYAVHYLTEAKDRGYRIPKTLMDSALGYIKQFAEQEPKDLRMARVQAYGAYLLARNEIIATKSLTSLEKWIEGYKDDSWIKDITLLYMAGAYKMMKASDKAQTFIRKFDDASKMPTDYQYGVYDDTIKRAMHLYLVSKHFPEMIGEFDGKKLNELVDWLSKNYNTTSSALSILAFEAYAQRVKAESGEGIFVKELLTNNQNVLALQGSLFPNTLFSPTANKIAISNTTENVAYYSVTQAGFDKGPSGVEVSNGIEVFREYLNSDSDVVEKATIGEELTVRLRGRTIDGKLASNVAIVDLLPGGFEVVLDSIHRSNRSVEYVDAREDRVLIFSDFHKDVKTFEYKIKAINKGRYHVPPIFSESMYDRGLQSKGLSSQIVVE